LSYIVAQRFYEDKIISTTKMKEANVQLAARPGRPERLGGLVSLMALNDKKLENKNQTLT
jgi:hypothetical protein